MKKVFFTILLFFVIIASGAIAQPYECPDYEVVNYDFGYIIIVKHLNGILKLTRNFPERVTFDLVLVDKKGNWYNRNSKVTWETDTMYIDLTKESFMLTNPNTKKVKLVEWNKKMKFERIIMGDVHRCDDVRRKLVKYKTEMYPMFEETDK